MMTPRSMAWSSADFRLPSVPTKGRTSAKLKLITRAPAPMQSRIAAASSSGLVLGSYFPPAPPSLKIGRTSRVPAGQMAGASEPRLADKMPARNVPCRQAELLESRHEGPSLTGEFLDRAFGKVRMIPRNGAVDEAYTYFWRPASKIHQRRQPDEIQSSRGVSALAFCYLSKFHQRINPCDRPFYALGRDVTFCTTRCPGYLSIRSCCLQLSHCALNSC